jgi:hypothetical protein
MSGTVMELETCRKPVLLCKKQFIILKHFLYIVNKRNYFARQMNAGLAGLFNLPV